MKRLTQPLLAVLCLALSSASLHSALSYLDSNGTYPGAGPDVGLMLWGNASDTLGNPWWSYDPLGLGATNAWVDGDTAVFSAATDATNAFNVVVDSSPYNPSVGGIIFEEGEVTLYNGPITMTNQFECPIICYTNGIINSDLSDVSPGSGTCGIRKTGPGKLTLGSNTSGYGGTNTVAEGILAVTGISALGNALVPTVVSNGAALEQLVAFTPGIPEFLNLNGFGITNGGALMSRAGLGGQNGWNGVIVLDSPSRINYYGQTNNYWNLKKVQTNGVTDCDLYLGGNGNTMRLNADGCLLLGEGVLHKDGAVSVRWEAPCYAKELRWDEGPMLSRVGAFLRHGTPSSYVVCTNYVGQAASVWNANLNGTFSAPWVLLDGANPVFQGAITFQGALSGPGGWIKYNDANTVTMTAANTYSGNTVICGGTLTLSASGSISNTATVDVQSGAVFNVTSNASGFTLQSAQTLKGNGTVWGNVKANGTLSPGASIGTLTFNNNLTIGGNLYIEVERVTPSNDKINVTGTLANTAAGFVLVVNINPAAPLQVGDSFTIFNQAVVNGGAMAAVVGGGVLWTNELASSGKITVIAGSLPSAATGLTATKTWPTTVVLTAMGDPNKAYRIYTAPTVTTPMANWTLIGAAVANGSGVIQFTDTQATQSEKFYRLGQ